MKEENLRLLVGIVIDDVVTGVMYKSDAIDLIVSYSNVAERDQTSIIINSVNH